MGLKGAITLQNGLTANDAYISLGAGMIQVSRNLETSEAYRGGIGKKLTADERNILGNEGVGKYKMLVYCPIFANESARKDGKDNITMHGQSWNFNDETNIWGVAYAKLKEVYPNTTDC